MMRDSAATEPSEGMIPPRRWRGGATSAALILSLIVSSAAAALLWAQNQTLQQAEDRNRQKQVESEEAVRAQEAELEILQERIIALADEKANEQDRADEAEALNGALQEAGTDARSVAEQALLTIENLNRCLSGQQEWNSVLQGALDGQRFDQQAVQRLAGSINSTCSQAQQEVETLNLLISRTR